MCYSIFRKMIIKADALLEKLQLADFTVSPEDSGDSVSFARAY